MTQPQPMTVPASQSWLETVRRAVDERLSRFFADERAAVGELAPDALLVLRGLESLTLRGGKRLRPAMLVAAQRAIEPRASLSMVLSACASLEILQSYLLIHDDWMDGDEERRGGPAVHVLIRRELGGRGVDAVGAHLADSLAILAGDLGCAYANRLFLESANACGAAGPALETYLRVQRDVVLGQTLDLLGSPDVSRMHDLKTGSYTVEGPLLLGAILAGAHHAQLDVLRRVARPLGEAFQVRDDLLGTFGDPKKTGKPVGNDLRVGKHNAIVRECELSVPAETRAPLTAILGRIGASDDDVRRAMTMLEQTGVRARVEARLAKLVDEAKAPLAGAPLSPEGVRAISELADLFGARES
ncbi:MAG: polyprenyl synthetase family protein [Sandaracinaceae bacterium]|nr:polyprenyl synthetase family protein [Sandaracinaceae bacterium]